MNANYRAEPLQPAAQVTRSEQLAARLEPFDSYWQAPRDVEKGFSSFTAYYRANYLAHMPADRDARILVISCGPGYLVKMLLDCGYRAVLGVDSDAAKVAVARAHQLPCETARAFEYLQGRNAQFDVIVPEQELNHLTLDETVEFLRLCRQALRPGGRVVVYAMNGANPLVGSENLSHNIDHFYNVTEYSLGQILQLAGFSDVRVFALKLYVFWKNPLNYVGLAVTGLLELAMRVIFMLYGKKVRVLSKKVAAVAQAPR
ncbi:MAG TPA: class I SAM-dependent methyltransferase [Steroidobacteraceae bacterium]|nr:class I SAM-dependent methyltransferase [Steroidobacteraceae bacterium]